MSPWSKSQNTVIPITWDSDAPSFTTTTTDSWEGSSNSVIPLTSALLSSLFSDYSSSTQAPTNISSSSQPSQTSTLLTSRTQPLPTSETWVPSTVAPTATSPPESSSSSSVPPATTPSLPASLPPSVSIFNLSSSTSRPTTTPLSPASPPPRTSTSTSTPLPFGSLPAWVPQSLLNTTSPPPPTSQPPSSSNRCILTVISGYNVCMIISSIMVVETVTPSSIPTATPTTAQAQSNSLGATTLQQRQRQRQRQRTLPPQTHALNIPNPEPSSFMSPSTFTSTSTSPFLLHPSPANSTTVISHPQNLSQQQQQQAHDFNSPYSPMTTTPYPNTYLVLVLLLPSLFLAVILTFYLARRRRG